MQGRVLGRVYRGRPDMEAESMERLWRWPMTAATLLVIPDLLMSGPIAAALDWVIWLVFAGELVSIAFLANDGGAWVKKNPLAVAVMVLSPPVAPAAMQGIRVLRLFRLLRLARGWQHINRVFTPEGLPFLVGIGAVLVFFASVLFSTVETHAHTHVSLANGIWWALGVVSTEGSSINASTITGHIITVALMILGICLFSLITAGLTQRFVGHKQAKQLSAGEQAILEELHGLRARLELLEGHQDGPARYAEN